MTRRDRVRSMTDRQLHQALQEAFGEWMLKSPSDRGLVEVHDRVGRLLQEEGRRVAGGRARCVCELCFAPVQEKMSFTE